MVSLNPAGVRDMNSLSASGFLKSIPSVEKGNSFCDIISKIKTVTRPATIPAITDKILLPIMVYLL
jgi:hypothetical protein